MRLGERNDPQPDVLLFILPTHGGRVQLDDQGYVIGAPDLVVEVAASRASYDLHAKLDLYRRHRVREYVVFRTWDRKLDWFFLKGSAYVRRSLPRNGVHRSGVCPGLWLDVAALMCGDLAKVLAILQEGILSPEHTAFVAKLAKAAKRSK